MFQNVSDKDEQKGKLSGPPQTHGIKTSCGPVISAAMTFHILRGEVGKPLLQSDRLEDAQRQHELLFLNTSPEVHSSLLV